MSLFFPGSIVIMAERPPKPLGDLRAGELLLGPGLRPSEVVKVHEERLEGRYVLLATESDCRVACADDALVFVRASAPGVVVGANFPGSYIRAAEVVIGDQLRCYFGACGPRTNANRFWEDSEWGPVSVYSKVVQADRRPYSGFMLAPEIAPARPYDPGSPGSGAAIFVGSITFQTKTPAEPKP